MTTKSKNTLGNQSTFYKQKQNESSMSFRYTNESYSGCDMTASITMRINKPIEDSSDTPINSKAKTARTRNNPSYSQSDMAATIYTRVIGELQTVSYSIHMEKRPVRSIGNVNAKDYVIGPRTIAGSLVFSVFNRHFAKEILAEVNGDTGTAFLVDELPPFDITISAANEYGYRSRLVIYGVRLVNEGQVMSINDVYTENTYQFMATDVEYLNDEMKYSSKLNGETLYKLNDPYIEYHREKPYEFLQNEVKFIETNRQKEDKAKRAAQTIRLTANVIQQPTKKSSYGKVDFYLNTNVSGSYTGNFYIKDSKGNKQVVYIKNKTALLNAKFKPELYTAHFETDAGKKSNEIKFEIKPYFDSDSLIKYAPVVTKVTDTTVTIYANEPTHTFAAISKKYENDFTNYPISKKSCTIENLVPNTLYEIYTYNEKEKLPSRTITFKTLDSQYKLYDEFIKFIHANAPLMVFKSLKIYLELIQETKDIYPNLEPQEGIHKLKSDYLKAYKEEESASLKDEYDMKIKALNELIILAVKLQNNFIAAVNNESSLSTPTCFYDENYNNVISFDDEITSAEFFRAYPNINQFASSVKSSNFKTIKEVKNSFRFLGKPGLNHYVQGIYNHVRTPKLYFYSMTDKEKQEFIKKENSKNVVSKDTLDKLQTVISKEYDGANLKDNYEKAIMLKLKTIDNPLVASPQVDEMNKDKVYVKTAINSLINSDFENCYHLAIASYNDVITSDYIYKVPFANQDKCIEIDRVFNGLKKDCDYVLWIENDDYVQISNPTTFSFSDDYDLENDEVKNYELKNIIEDINGFAETYFSADVCNGIKSEIENNQFITSYNLVEHVLSILSSFTLKKVQFLGFMSLFYKYLGIIDGYNGDLITNLSYDMIQCSFNTEKEGSILIYGMSPGKDTKIYNMKMNESNTINFDDFNEEILIIVAIDNSLLYKSEVIIVNKSEKYVEVI